MRPPPERLVALGASNLTRGLPVLVSAARAAAGPEVEIIAALGLGRSYGMESRVLMRRLPGILDCGLWSALERFPPRRTRALVTDVGNDILYGASPTQILEWVAESLCRLNRITDDIVVAGLPLHSIRRLSPAKFLAFRTLLFHRCRLEFGEVVERTERIAEGLVRLADRHRARFVALRPEWYGFDPVHVRPRHWGVAWREILGIDESNVPRSSLAEAARIHSLSPERQWLFGTQTSGPAEGTRLSRGGRVWLF